MNQNKFDDFDDFVIVDNITDQKEVIKHVLASKISNGVNLLPSLHTGAKLILNGTEVVVDSTIMIAKYAILTGGMVVFIPCVHIVNGMMYLAFSL